ncbi:hypothetical protein MCUN1_000551 [Malassezia cuniculi]|uniref:Probable RNA polymerase II nuclear localization protein SLC7A6OS n=1 Tax=Malassezia cuniculi TaxID=948313 RepID=A0AAF0J9W9_9BASI|nr:hypothetical protein MCUN1_000551 [Malassezia cuniculi]
MSAPNAPAVTRTVLRVKRKRQDDPIDAFRFEHPNSDRPEADVSGAHRIIDAEWDANARRISLKRSREGDEEVRAQRQRTESAAMAKFTDMLAEYLKCTSKLTTVEQESAPESRADLSPNLSNGSIEDYVYDIYYRDQPVQPKPKPAPKKSAPAELPQLRAPPTVGRASRPRTTYSPLPPARHSTSAPGFEHLESATIDGDDDDDDWDRSLMPVALKRQPNGELQVINATVTDELVADESPEIDDDDEDSNDEDYYLNDYPDDWSGSEY